MVGWSAMSRSLATMKGCRGRRARPVGAVGLLLRARGDAAPLVVDGMRLLLVALAALAGCAPPSGQGPHPPWPPGHPPGLQPSWPPGQPPPPQAPSPRAQPPAPPSPWPPGQPVPPPAPPPQGQAPPAPPPVDGQLRAACERTPRAPWRDFGTGEQLFSQVVEGWTTARVLALLGAPEDCADMPWFYRAGQNTGPETVFLASIPDAISVNAWTRCAAVKRLP